MEFHSLTEISDGLMEGRGARDVQTLKEMFAREDGTITAGAILLDREFDATSTRRRLLRTHELGHTLGYNHVHSRTSVMNPSIGTEPNDFDREAAFIAFRAPAIVASR